MAKLAVRNNALVLHPDSDFPMVLDTSEDCCCEDTPCCCTQFDPFESAPTTVTATVIGCGPLSSGTVTLNRGAGDPCPSYTGENLVGNCGGNVSLGMTLTCPGGIDSTIADFMLEVRRTSPNCTVNGGASQTLSLSSGTCEPLSLTFGPYGPVDDSGLAPGTCDCCPGGSFNVLITA